MLSWWSVEVGCKIQHIAPQGKGKANLPPILWCDESLNRRLYMSYACHWRHVKLDSAFVLSGWLRP